MQLINALYIFFAAQEDWLPASTISAAISCVTAFHHAFAKFNWESDAMVACHQMLNKRRTTEKGVYRTVGVACLLNCTLLQVRVTKSNGFSPHLSCICCGAMSSTRWVPVLANPPACSTRNAMGKHCSNSTEDLMLTPDTWSCILGVLDSMQWLNHDVEIIKHDCCIMFNANGTQLGSC